MKWENKEKNWRYVQKQLHTGMGRCPWTKTEKKKKRRDDVWVCVCVCECVQERVGEREREMNYTPHILTSSFSTHLIGMDLRLNVVIQRLLSLPQILNPFFLLLGGNWVCCATKLDCCSLLEFSDRTLFRFFYRVSPTQQRIRFNNKEWKSFLRKKVASQCSFLCYHLLWRHGIVFESFLIRIFWLFFRILTFPRRRRRN